MENPQNVLTFLDHLEFGLNRPGPSTAGYLALLLPLPCLGGFAWQDFPADLNLIVKLDILAIVR